MEASILRKKNDNEITEILKMIAPGTPIRDGLENILRAKTGALLLITDNNDIIKELYNDNLALHRELSKQSKVISMNILTKVAMPQR